MKNDFAMEVLDSLVTEWANRFGINYVNFSWSLQEKLKSKNVDIQTKPERGFEWLGKFSYRYDSEYSEFRLPTRSTDLSAGYDFFSPEAAIIPAGGVHVFNTGIKAFMQEDEVLEIHIRSSLAIKKGLVLQNQVGIIDADYYNNVTNEGNILIPIVNTSDKPQEIKFGERIAQGIFVKYLTCGDIPSNKRVGGVGSTGC